MDLPVATPAPRVEPAIADSIPSSERVVATMAPQSEPPNPTPAMRVDPDSTSYPSNNNSINDDKGNLPTPVRGSQPSDYGWSVPMLSSLSPTQVRGQNGADLECYAAVLRGAPERNFLQILLPCIYDERDFVAYGEVKKYILIKAGTCFVYGEHTDPSPIYAIPLNEMTCLLENPNRLDKFSVTISPLPDSNRSPPWMVTVLLKYRNSGKQAYQFTFDTQRCHEETPRRFMDLVDQQTRGQSVAPPLTQSVMVAQKIAKEAIRNQPVI